MLLSDYETRGLLFNVNFRESAGASGFDAYRGELVVREGEIADAQGRRKPPQAVLKQVVLLSDAEKLHLLAGFLDDVADLPELLGMYGADFAEGASVILYARNLGKPVQAQVGGARLIVIPLIEGMVWNELLDELILEKGDFKGQSAGEKVMTANNALAGYKPKYETVEATAIPALAVEVRYEARGAV
ncbi:MAG: hypothetical protein PHI49_07350 [Halothiobacillaceae bacterium]|nr:hypothetical protein [Halothiobacillaceae bacterium]